MIVYDKYSFHVPDALRLRYIVNTDAKNEADDQYAIVHALLSPKFDNIGIIGAHFGVAKSSHSMQDSVDEIIKLLDLMGLDKALAFHGGAHALTDEHTPVPSQGADLIVSEAMKDDPRPLFVAFMGPLTDLASALLIEPRIADRLTAIWIGGGEYPAGGYEYNLSNDIHAANVVMKSSVNLWQIPRDVYSRMMISLAELALKVQPQGAIGDYLYRQLVDLGQTDIALDPQVPWSGENWVLGDSPAVGVLLGNHSFCYAMVPAPEIAPDMRYVQTGANRAIKVYSDIDSRFILEDFFAKLAHFARNQKS